MFRKLAGFILVVLVTSLMLTACSPVEASTEAGTVISLGDFINALLAMGGITAVIVLAINAGKQVGIVKDGDAPAWNKGLHAGVYILLIAWYLVHPDIDLAVINDVAQQMAELGMALLAMVPLFAGLVAPAVNNGVKGLPVVGFSHSG